MDPTTPPGDTVRFADWFLAHADSRRQGLGVERDKEWGNFIGFLWPVGVEVSSPLNPVFLGEFKKPELLHRQKIWLARDGLIPLLWFFRMNPLPPARLKSHIFVYRDFARFVPEGWRDHIGTYSFESFREPDRVSPKILLTGLLMQTYCNHSHICLALERIRASLKPSQLKKAEFLAFLPGRYDAWGGERNHEFHLKCAFEIADKLGTGVRPINWSQFEAKDSFLGYELVSLNQNYLCADDYLTHSALARGAALGYLSVGYAPKRPGGTLIRLSPYYGMRIHQDLPKLKGEPNIWKDLSAFESILKTEANVTFPWPKWFVSWTQRVKE